MTRVDSPPVQQPIFDANGRMTPAWSQFFENLVRAVQELQEG